jgi:hypothetical protein
MLQNKILGGVACTIWPDFQRSNPFSKCERTAGFTLAISQKPLCSKRSDKGEALTVATQVSAEKSSPYPVNLNRRLIVQFFENPFS